MNKAEIDNLQLNELNDKEIAQRMRQCNYEKFKSLVRMHLSFELELNTDEFDLPCHEIVYEDKGKLKKWNRVSKKHKTNASTGSTQNSPTEGLNQQIDAGFMLHLEELREFLLLEKNITQEGLFRKTGSVSRQNDLRLQIQNDKPLKLESSNYSAHDCATVFKSYLAELPEPLLTDAHYPAHLQLAPLCLASAITSCPNVNPAKQKREENLLNSVQLLIQLLPADNRSLLQHIIDMLHQVAKHAHLNKMNSDNLATLFAPHLICPRNLPPEALHYVAKKMSGLIAYMIQRGNDVFGIPGKLTTDIRAYFIERKRKQTMSPEQTLDESISDVSTVNTVYTFVDREKTAAAHNANNTDTELAQLYAFIQSMPESAKKRRLIKQFNKQNGQGTPLQFVMMNRIRNSEAARSTKSISDSIKKHIFNNCMISRTPKHNNNNAEIETPNMGTLKKPKQRVLFQSPSTSYLQPKSVGATGGAMLAASTSCLTPIHNLKSHPLQKSISSSSLLSATKIASKATYTNCSPSDNCDLTPSQPLSYNGSGSQIPFKFTTEVGVQIVDKKTVAWDEMCLLQVEEISNNCTPCSETSVELKSRYKSEPNLSSIVSKHKSINANTPTVSKNISALTLTRKLMKGVSMGNLKFPFSTPDNTKRLRRTVSSTLKRRSTEEIQIGEELASGKTQDCVVPLLEDVDDLDLDDDTFEDNSADQLGSEEETDDESQTSLEDDVIKEDEQKCDQDREENLCLVSNEICRGRRKSGCYRHLLVQNQNTFQRNLELITSTPSTNLGRRSMSPITKSTQRMPKSMQESIMTPRSRKPVMVLTSLVGTSEQNQAAFQADLSSFPEQDEEESSSTEESSYEASTSHVLTCRQELLEASKNFINQSARLTNPITAKVMMSANMEEKSILPTGTKGNDELSTNFKEYLLSRSVMMTSPADSSFSSQPDDFNTGSLQDIEELDNSQLSPSLLFCLDGNEPSPEEFQVCDIPAPASGLNNFNNARKRAATHTIVKSEHNLKNNSTAMESNKENNVSEENDGYMLSKKLLISEYPGETSF